MLHYRRVTLALYAADAAPPKLQSPSLPPALKTRGRSAALGSSRASDMKPTRLVTTATIGAGFQPATYD